MLLAIVLLWRKVNQNLPQIVEAAMQTSATAAHNIIADINNKEKESL